MKITALAAVALAGLTLAACAPGYYDDGYYNRHAYRDGYYGGAYPGGAYYTDRTNDPYYTDSPSREHRVYGERYDRYDDRD